MTHLAEMCGPPSLTETFPPGQALFELFHNFVALISSIVAHYFVVRARAINVDFWGVVSLFRAGSRECWSLLPFSLKDALRSMSQGVLNAVQLQRTISALASFAI